MATINHTCIIDDDIVYTFTTKKVMELVQFANHIEVFKNGQEALNSLVPRMKSGDNLPDVIFLDLNMPIMDGWNFLDEFTQVSSPKEITIYIVTSSIAPEDINKSKSYSAVSNYLVKPITVDKLKSLLEEIG